MRRWLTIAFAVSVALNLFFLGVAGARFWQHRQWRAERGDAALIAPGAKDSPGRRGQRHSRSGSLSWMTDAERSELRPKRQALIGIRKNAEQVLSSEPLDVAQLRNTLEALRAQTLQIQSAVHDHLIDRAQKLGPDERRKLADVSWGTPGERARPERH